MYECGFRRFPPFPSRRPGADVRLRGWPCEDFLAPSRPVSCRRRRSQRESLLEFIRSNPRVARDTFHQRSKFALEHLRDGRIRESFGLIGKQHRPHVQQHCAIGEQG